MDGIFQIGNRLSSPKLPSKSRLSLLIIKIIALKDRQYRPKTTKTAFNTESKRAFEGGLKIPNLTCRQSRNFGPSLGNRNSVIKPLIIMKNTEFVGLLTNNNYHEYQEK